MYGARSLLRRRVYPRVYRARRRLSCVSTRRTRRYVRPRRYVRRR